MFHYFEAITNTSGDSLIGYFARVVDPATQNTVTISADDNGTPIVTTSGVENAAVTDAYGNLDFYVVPGTYHLDIYAPNATSLILRVQNVSMNSTKGDPGEQGEPGATGASNNSRETLAALKAADIADLTSLYNGSLWTWTTGNFTGQADDIDVVKANSTALTVGAWVRQQSAGLSTQRTGSALRRSQQAKNDDIPNFRDFPSAITGDVSAINAMLVQLRSEGRTWVDLAESVTVGTGTILLPQGMGIRAGGGLRQYFTGQFAGSPMGGALVRGASGADVPLIELATASSLEGLFLRDLRTAGQAALVQYGNSSNSTSIYNSVLRNCHFYGNAISEVTGNLQNLAATALLSPESDLGINAQRYFLQIAGCFFTNWGRAIDARGQSNGWSISGLFARQCYAPFYFDGGASEIADTVISGFHAQNIGALPSAPSSVFKLKGSINVLSATGVSECNCGIIGGGMAIDDTELQTFAQIDLTGYRSNEPVTGGTKIASVNSQIGEYAPVRSRGGAAFNHVRMRTGPSSDSFPSGSKIEAFGYVSGALPALNGAANAFPTATASAKRILTFNNRIFSKAGNSSNIRAGLSGTLILSAQLATTSQATHETRVDFSYLPGSDGSNNGVGKLVVWSVAQSPASGNYLTSVGFNPGKGASDTFGINVNGGALGVGTTLTALYARFEGHAQVFNEDGVLLTAFENVSLVSAALTSDDTSNTISLLTPATTTV